MLPLAACFRFRELFVSSMDSLLNCLRHGVGFAVIQLVIWGKYENEDWTYYENSEPSMFFTANIFQQSCLIFTPAREPTLQKRTPEVEVHVMQK